MTITHGDARDRKTRALAELVGALAKPHRILVVGCGDGREAALLAQYFDAEVTGIDLGGQFEFDTLAASQTILKIMDAQRMEFPDNCFDLVYSFHALEHIPNPSKALSEMNRVLKPGGCFAIGTPNKNRLIGYFGSAASLSDKVKWNFNDWMMRLRGRWSNKLGAHAGYSESELMRMCQDAFGEACSVTHHYYRAIYGTKKIDLLIKVGSTSLILPCVYVVGKKSDKYQTG